MNRQPPQQPNKGVSRPKGKKKKNKKPKKQKIPPTMFPTRTIIKTKKIPYRTNQTIENRSKTEAIRLKRTEIMCECASTPAYVCEAFRFNPGNEVANGIPWLGFQSRSWNKYQIASITYRYSPSVAANYPGSYQFAIDYETKDEIPVNWANLGTQAHPRVFPIHQPFEYTVPTKGFALKPPNKYSVQHNAVPSEAEAPNYYPFTLMWASTGSPAVNSPDYVPIVGTMYISYTIDFYDPHMDPNNAQVVATTKLPYLPYSTNTSKRIVETGAMSRANTLPSPQEFFKQLLFHPDSTFQIPPGITSAVRMAMKLANTFSDSETTAGNITHPDNVKYTTDNGQNWFTAPDTRVTTSATDLYDLDFNVSQLMYYVPSTVFAFFNDNTRLYAKGCRQAYDTWGMVSSIIRYVVGPQEDDRCVKPTMMDLEALRQEFSQLQLLYKHPRSRTDSSEEEKKSCSKTKR